MKNPAQFELVIQALSCGVTGCVEWQPKEAERVRSDSSLKGLTPETILEDLIDFVANGGGKLQQVLEKRPQWSHREYYYKAMIPYADLFRKGLFVEMELHDDDPDLPVVLLVNAHEQK
jgi:hypothetical protein